LIDAYTTKKKKSLKFLCFQFFCYQSAVAMYKLL